MGAPVTEDEARAEAVRLGALEPQGFWESVMANWIENTSSQKWRDTAKAQQRGDLWTEAVLAGQNPRKTIG
jgi:hypothetical protein